MDVLSLILLNIIDKIKFKDYVIYSELLAISVLVFSVSNYFFIYFIRILPMFDNESGHENSRKILGKVSNTGAYDSKKFSSINMSIRDPSYGNFDNIVADSTISSSNSKIIELSKKIMNYHNQTNISLNLF